MPPMTPFHSCWQGGRELPPEAAHVLEALALWLAFLLVVPTRAWTTLPIRFRHLIGGRRRWLFDPPLASPSPWQALLSQSVRILELGVPVFAVALVAERRSTRVIQEAETRWRGSASAVLLELAQGRIDEPECRRLLQSRGLPIPAEKAAPPSPQARPAMSVDWFLERETAAALGLQANGDGSTLSGAIPAPHHSVLDVTTLSAFVLRDGSGDVTPSLLRSPVLSFIWLHLMTRAMVNPKEWLSRAQLADELTPGLAESKQRKRLRDRLSDLSAEFPPSLVSCINLEGDLVRFDLTQCSVDLIRLVDLANETSGQMGMLSDRLADEIADIIDSTGGEFLPNWDELEREVTGGRGTAGDVVRELRERAEASRVDLLGSLALNHLARRHPERAIPLLEQALQKHPQREDLARILRASYLESGQPSRARTIQQDYRLE